MGGGGGGVDPSANYVITFQIFYLKRFIVSYKNKVLSHPPGYLITKKNKMMYYIKEVYTEENLRRLILFLIDTCYTSSILTCSE